MKKILQYISIICIILIILGNFQIVKAEFQFIENKGQVTDEFGNRREDVLFIGSDKDFKIILTSNSIHYQFEKPQPILNEHKPKDKNTLGTGEINISVNRIDVLFVGSNPKCNVIVKGQSNDYINYIKANLPEPISFKCYSYDTIVFQSIYEKIDLICYSSKPQSIAKSVSTKENKVVFKYDFIIHNGGNVSDIKMKYNGADKISLVNDKVIVKQGEIIFEEHIPVSFLSDGSKINVGYQLAGSEISFSAEKNEKKLNMTIDPYFIYSSYYGGTLEDVGMEVASDKDGNYYVGGYSNSTNNIATSGAYQTTLKGEKDAFLVKFSTLGVRVWCTYYGGTNFDFGHSLDCDKQGNVYLGGWTQSRQGMATLNSFQYNYGGGEFDSFLAKFNSNGNLIWSTYFGGQYEDYINDVVIDGNLDIVFIGRTSSPTNIATAGVFQTEFGGNYDMFIQKFTSNGIRIWGTFYGGEGFDVGMELCTDIFNNIAFTGYTQSKTSMASENAHKDTLSGIWDAFVGKLDRNGKRIWGTYVGGEDEDNGWGIGSDGLANIFITGNTNSTEGISTSGSHKPTLLNDELDAFVIKFSKHGERLWGTYFGGEDEEFGNAGVIDAWDNFIFSGNSMSDSGIVTADAPQNARASQRDAFLSKFNNKGQQIFGTYFGAANNEYGHGVTVDKDGRFLMTGYTFSSNLTTTGDAAQPDFGGGNDGFIMKIGDALPSDSIFVEDFKDTLCADNQILIPFSVNNSFNGSNVFTAQLSNLNGMFTEFYNIGTLTSTSSGTITGWIPREALTGNKYRIRVVGSSPEVIGDDNGFDLSIFELPMPEITGTKDVCEVQSYSYQANKSVGLLYRWYVTGGSFQSSSVEDEATIEWGISGEGTLKLVEINATTGCMDSTEIVIRIHPEVVANAIFGPNEICPKNDIVYYSSRGEGILNLWKSNGGNIVGDNTSDTIVVNWNESSVNQGKTGTLQLIQYSELNGCSDSTFITVKLKELPQPFIIGDSIVGANTSKIYRTSSLSKYTYFWTVDGGIFEGGENSSIAYVKWGKAGNGSICLHEVDRETGCEDSLKITVFVRDNAADIISGSKSVCSKNKEIYSVSDTNYSYKWGVVGGELMNAGDSTGLVSEILWGNVGAGCILLIREKKSDKSRDTLMLDIVIGGSPDFFVSGVNAVCEGVVGIYYSENFEGISNLWLVEGGSIIGTDTADSVIVYWDRAGSDTASVRTGKVSLTKNDTLSKCSRSENLSISINKTVVADFKGDTIVCENELSDYLCSKSQDSKIDEINWHIAGGIIVSNSGDTSITVKWGKQGKGFVQNVVKGKNGCSDSLMFTVTINKSPEKPLITQSGKTLFSNAEEGNQWFFKSESTSEVNVILGATSMTFSPEVSGFYSVQVIGINGCLSEMSNFYYFDINNVSDFYQKNIVIFPNPVTDIFTIELNLLNYNDVEIKLFDILGRVVVASKSQKESYKIMRSEGSFKIDMYNEPEGVYMLAILFNDGRKVVYRVVKI